MGFEQEGLEGAAGKAGAADERLNGEGGLRDAGGVLEQSDVAGHEGGCGEAEDLPEGEVPGHDGEDDAEGIPADVAVVAVGGDGLFGEDTLCVFSVVAAAGGAFEDLGAGAREGLAHLLGEQGGELFNLMLHDAGELAHAEGAVLEGNLLVDAEGDVGDADFGAEGVFGEGLEAAEELACGGIDGLDRHGGYWVTLPV